MKLCFIIIVLSIQGSILCFAQNYLDATKAFFSQVDELNGNGLNCDIHIIENQNSEHIYPLLQNLVTKPYFKFFKVNLNKKCPFWPDNRVCSSRYCHVQSCETDSLPAGLREASFLDNKNCSSINTNQTDLLNSVNKTISKYDQDSIFDWQQHDSTSMNFCVIEDETSKECEYVDLLLNPEQFTAYSGYPAHKIWKAVYEENCFYDYGSPLKVFGITHDYLKNQCFEKRAFYFAVSGLHSSITIHLCSKYYFPDKSFNRNPVEFANRFCPPSQTDRAAEGVKRFRNLYFVYLLELRALAKASYQLRNEEYYTGNETDDNLVRSNMNQLLSAIRRFPCHFDEHVLFQGKDASEKAQLKEELRSHFLNISRIMDCVSCDKCRLWGKLQTQGLGTAFKILFDPGFSKPTLKKLTRLKRTEIVTLVNAFARLSNSLNEIATYYRHLTSDDVEQAQKKLFFANFEKNNNKNPFSMSSGQGPSSEKTSLPQSQLKKALNNNKNNNNDNNNNKHNKHNEL